MQVISTRKFRANQKKYLVLAKQGLVLVVRKNKKPIALYVADNDDKPSKEELLAIQRGLEDLKNSRTIKIENFENIWDSIL